MLASVARSLRRQAATWQTAAAAAGPAASRLFATAAPAAARTPSAAATVKGGRRRTPSTPSVPEPIARVVVACVLERGPIVLPDLLPWEAELEEWKARRQAPFFKDYPETESERDSRKIAEMLKEEVIKGDAFEEEKAVEWAAASRVTTADATGDRSTPHRRLPEFLFMLVKSALAPGWGFPQAAPQDGETVRTAGERALLAAIGTGPRVYTVGNAPAGHFTVPAAADGGPPGPATLFFLTVQLIEGPVVPVSVPGAKGASTRGTGPGAAKEIAWVTRAELGEYVSPELHAYLQRMLPGPPQDTDTTNGEVKAAAGTARASRADGTATAADPGEPDSSPKATEAGPSITESVKMEEAKAEKKPRAKKVKAGDALEAPAEP